MVLVVDQFVARTPRDVWRIATDWAIAEFWLGTNKLRQFDRSAKPRVGTKLIFDVRGQSHSMTITSWEPPHRLGLEAEQGGITACYEYTFSEAEGGTRLQLEAKCRARSAGWRLFLPLVGWLLERADRKQLEALVALVEATTGGPPSAPSTERTRGSSKRAGK